MDEYMLICEPEYVGISKIKYSIVGRVKDAGADGWIVLVPDAGTYKVASRLIFFLRIYGIGS